MYKHTQIGWGIVIIFGLLALLAYFKILGNDGAEGVVYGILLLVTMLFAELTVTVDDQYVRLRFGLFGLPRRKFKLQEIQSCRTVKNTMFAISLGIHYGRNASLYNVSGPRAVELTMKNGRIVNVGTDEPDRLAAALNLRLQDGRGEQHDPA